MVDTLASEGSPLRSLCPIVLLLLPCCQPKAGFHETAIVNNDPATKVELIVSPDVPHREINKSTHTFFVKKDKAGTMRLRSFDLLIGEEPLEYTTGTLMIGDRSFGDLKGPTKIEIKPDGVFVNDELRGQLDFGGENEAKNKGGE